MDVREDRIVRNEIGPCTGIILISCSYLMKRNCCLTLLEFDLIDVAVCGSDPAEPGNAAEHP